MTLIYSDENSREVNERLVAADELVKQHIKVAEEAISGWEKDKSEYVSIKNQLEVVLEQKQAAEDIISHLDGALKVCMQDLRHLREEQEEKIHEAIIKKTRDCENISLELEEKLRDASGELAASRYENAQLLNIVREQSDTISEIERARSQFEESVVRLQVHIGTLEKENASLKYEIISVNKELVMCNQEKEINKRSGKTFRKQHLDDIKKIDKLDTECQRLKNLVRKQLPCPGSLVQMKQETNFLDAEKSEVVNKKYRSSMGSRRGVSSPKSVHSESFFRPERLLRDQGLTMEEIKTSKEALAKKSKELHAVKLVNSWATDKLAMFERQPQSSPRKASSLIFHVNDALDSPVSLGCRQERSQASISEDGHDDERSIADSWASMLITELTEFQKEKAALEQSTKTKDLVWLDSTDDFVEMERFASLSSEREDRSDCGKANLMPAIAQVTNISVARKDRIPSNFDTGEKAIKTSPELMSAVCELMWLVEEMALEALAQRDTCNVVKDGNPNNVNSISPFDLGLNPKNFTSVGYQFLHGQMELVNFIVELSSALGQIKTMNIRNASIVRKFKEAPFSLGFREYTGGQEPQGFISELSSVSVQGTVEPDVSSDATVSLLKNASISDCSERNVATKCFITSDEKVDSLRGHQNNDEVRKLRAEKAALESHMRAEFSRIDMMEQMLVEIKQEKSDLQDVIRQEKEKVEIVKRELSDAEQLIESLRGKLSSVELSRDLTRERLQSSEALNGMLDSLVKEMQLESTQMAEKMESFRFEAIQMTTKMRTLEQSINEEQARNKALEIKLEELQESLERANSNILQNEAVLVAAKIDEGRSIVNGSVELGECHETILALETGSMNDMSPNSVKKKRDEGGERSSVSFGNGDVISNTIRIRKMSEEVLSDMQSSPNTPTLLNPIKHKSSLIKFFTRQKRN